MFFFSIKNKAFREITKLVTDPGSITFDEIARLTYLDMCVKETLRLFPIAAMIIRKTTQDFQIGNLNQKRKNEFN